MAESQNSRRQKSYGPPQGNTLALSFRWSIRHLELEEAHARFVIKEVSLKVIPDTRVYWETPFFLATHVPYRTWLK